MDKKGMSGVITILIVVSLALVAVGIVWYVIQGVISQGSEEVDTAVGNVLVAPRSCFDILSRGFSSSDGIYTIDPDGSGKKFEVYCDMTTDGGGWTRIDFAADLEHSNRWDSGDDWRWVDDDFTTTLSIAQIQAIQSVSTEGKQRYNGTCQEVLHYYNNAGSDYVNAFGFRFLNGDETVSGTENMGGIIFEIIEDGCKINSGTLGNTVWDVNDIRVPIINVRSYDSGESHEEFGSELTQNPAWLR